MDTQFILTKILGAKRWDDIFTGANFKQEYIDYMKILHPDICSLTSANEAVTKLNNFKDEIEALYVSEDDAGAFKVVDGRKIIFDGEKELLSASLINYKKLMSLTDNASVHFRKYLPSDMYFINNQLVAELNYRNVPITQLTLNQEHVNWIFSRILEFLSWVHQAGFCHLGLNPSSFTIDPENHGIICISFYHFTGNKMKVNTISGRYYDWYPPILFANKEANAYIDITLAKKTAIYLLGDKSGNGVKLKKTHNQQIIDFLLSPHYDSFSTYDSFRKLLLAEFGKPKFYKLNL